MSCVLNKVAASGNSIAGAAIGAGLGGLGGYQLGRFLKAGEAANALIAAAGALGGGTLGYRMGEDDPKGLGRPWHEWDKRNLFRLAGGLGGAGLGVLGNRALGIKNSPIGDLGAAVLMGGLGALGGDIAFDELDQGAQKKIEQQAAAVGAKSGTPVFDAITEANTTTPKESEKDKARGVVDKSFDTAGNIIGAVADKASEAAGETTSNVSKDLKEKGLLETVKEHPAVTAGATAIAVDAGRYSAAAYNAVKSRQVYNALVKAGQIPKTLSVQEQQNILKYISNQLAGNRTAVGEYFNFRPTKGLVNTLKLFHKPGTLDAAREFTGPAARNWTLTARQAIKPIGSILRAIIGRGK